MSELREWTIKVICTEAQVGEFIRRGRGIKLKPEVVLSPKPSTCPHCKLDTFKSRTDPKFGHYMRCSSCGYVEEGI